jgi:hypothetical protein
MHTRPYVLAACLLSGAAFAQHDHHAMPPDAAPAAAPPGRPAAGREWTRQPLLLPAMARRGERTAAVLKPRGIEAANVTVFAPEGPAERRRVDYPVDADGARIESATPKIGNYHWVIARAETPEEVRVASTAWYFANPGDSPKALLTEPKNELEIVPAPLPREHGSYRESEKWNFIVRFDSKPLANQPLTLETEFGSRTTFLTDRDGVATVLFPRDFKSVADKGEGGGHGPRRAKFVLATEKEAAGRHYLTAFNLAYGQDADRDRSLGWGAAFGLIGMLAATPLLRRRKNGAPENA